MGKGDSGGIDDHSADGAGDGHCLPCLSAFLSLIQIHQVPDNQRDRVHAERIGKGLCFSGRISLHAVTQRIKSDRSKHLLRHRHHILRIYNRCLCNDRRAAERLLVSGFRVREHRETISLGSCSACCGDQYERQCLITRPPIVDVIVKRAVIDCHECHALGGIHDASSADADNHIAAFLLHEVRALLCRCGERVRGNLVIQNCLQAGFLQAVTDSVKQSGFLRAGTSRDDQCLMSVLPGQRSGLLCFSISEHEVHRQEILEGIRNR